MIFKTFDSDIDKISSKWGMFGRSFNDIGTAIRNKIISLNKEFEQTGKIINSWKNSDSIWSRLYPSKENIKEQLIDVDKLIPEIDESKASKILEFIKSIEDGTNEEVKSFQELYDTGNKTKQWIAEYGQSTKDQIRSTKGIIEANQQARETVIANNNALKQQTLGAKAATVALQALATVGNMILFTVISKGIELIAVGFDNFLHRAEKFKESAEEARQSVEEITNSYKDLSAKVTDIKQRYAELAQGVNQTTGENKTLNTDEYAEFLDLSNQLAELFPSLTRKYTDNGEAILNLSGNVNTITSGLNDLVEAEKALANQQIIEKIPDILKGYNQNYFDITKDLADKKSWKDKLQTAYDSLQDTDKLYNSKVYDGDYAHIREVLNELGIEYSLVDEETGDAASFGRVSFSLNDYKNALDEISNALKIATKDVSNYNNKLKAENADFNKYLNTWLTDDWAYIGLHDSTLQDFVRDMLFNTDWLSEAKKQGINTTNWNDVSQWIEDNYILAIGSIDDEKVTNALVELYSLPSDLSPTQVKEITDEYISLIAKALDWDKLQIKVALGFEDTDTIARNYTAVMKNAAVKFSGVNIRHGSNDGEAPTTLTGDRHIAIDSVEAFQQEKAAIEAFMEENSINTQDEIAFWNQCIEESETKEEAMEKYLASAFAAGENNDLVPDITSSISTIASQLEPQFTRLGEAYSAIFTKDGFTLDAVDNSMLEGLRKSLAEIEEEIGVTFAPEKLEPFFAVLTDGNSTADDVHRAFNDLATAYLYSTATLEQLNEETAGAIEKQLSEMGVTNAHEVVLNALSEAKLRAVLAGYDLSNASSETMEAILNEGQAAGITEQMVYALTAAEIAYGDNDLSTEEKIDKLKTLAQAYGDVTTSALATAVANDLASGTDIDPEAALAELMDNFGKYKVDIDFSPFEKSVTRASSSSTKQAETDWKNLLDKETDLLEKQLAANVITFKEYTDRRRQILEDYYRDSKIKAEDYYDALESMYGSQLSLYDRVVNAVTNRIDEEIDKLNEQKELMKISIR